MHSNKLILSCRNINKLENHIAIYHNYNTHKILFFVQKNNFEDLFNIEINENNIDNGFDLLDIIHKDDIHLFCIFYPGSRLHGGAGPHTFSTFQRNVHRL